MMVNREQSVIMTKMLFVLIIGLLFSGTSLKSFNIYSLGDVTPFNISLLVYFLFFLFIFICRINLFKINAPLLLFLGGSITLLMSRELVIVDEVNRSFYFQFFRGIFISLSLLYLVKYKLVALDNIYMAFVALSVVASIAIYLQFVSFWLFGLPNLGVNYPTFVNSNDINSQFYIFGIVFFRAQIFMGILNYLALTILPGLMFSFKRDMNVSIVFRVLVFLFIFIAFLLTFSRGCILSFFMFLLFSLLQQKRWRLILVPLIIVSFLSVSFILDNARDKNATSSSTERKEIIYKSIELIVNYPFGIGNSIVNLNNGRYLSTHNTLLEGVLNFGVIFVFYLISIVYFLLGKNIKDKFPYFIGGVVAILFLETLIYPHMWLYFATIKAIDYADGEN